MSISPARRPKPASYSRARPFEAEITEHIRLSGSRSSSDTWHVELSLEGAGIEYEPGDSLGFVPGNDPALVETVLAAAGLAGDRQLHRRLSEQFDITTLTAPAFDQYVRLTDAAGLVRQEGWQVIDLLEAAPHRLSEEQLLSLLRPLAPRYYSIASSRKSVPDEAHLLIAAVRYQSLGRARNGVASVDVAERRKTGHRLRVFLKPNPHFRLPADPERPIVMIGPGTGVAPFRAFMQERDALGARGRNWLVFGHRNYTHDFLYQLEWQDLLKRGVLSRLDVAFSRDQPEKRYVQHALWDARRELFAWVQDGASIYVCGDANAMAKDVHATLQHILAEQGGGDGRRRWTRCGGKEGICAMSIDQRPPSANEGIKANSRFLRGTIAEGLTRVETGALAENDQQLTKFHGIYLQDDRDLRAERGRKKMEKAFIFMARLRVPGGVLTPAQWLAAEAVARDRGNGTLRLTTRQTIQFHGIIKSNLRQAIRGIDDAMLDTIAACGDVNRNVIARVNPWQSRAHAEVAGLARGYRRASAAEKPRLARDMDRRREGHRRRGGGRADLRPHLHAAQVQGRDRPAAEQRCGRVRA